jgi:catechol 2,3-dioxygenase-like lactoylglutathione lyase family enzyme
MGQPMPSCAGVLETSLYVADLERAKQFYRTVLELEVLDEDDRFCALNVAGRQVLLLFRKGATCEAVVLPGGTIPAHDGSGTLHLAFAITASDWSRWQKRLHEENVAIESEVAWPRGGHSLYFRDPDHHLIELATPGLWSIY